MDMSLIEMIGVIFKYMFSSVLSIEMLVLSLLLLGILLVNIKLKNKYINITAVGIYLGFILGIAISYSDYVQLCINSFVKTIMNFIYFPSTFAYYIEFVFVTGLMLYTIFNKKMKPFKKIINYICFTIMYFFFMSFITLSLTSGVDIYTTGSIYQNDVILALIQISNLLLLVWIVFTGFYELYKFFKKKYDKE